MPLLLKDVFQVFVSDFLDAHSAMANMFLHTSMGGVVAIVIATLVQVSAHSLSSVNSNRQIQWYFAFRLYRLSGFQILPIISSIFSLAHLVGFLAASINRYLNRPLTDEWRRCLFFVGILSIATDSMIVGGLVHGLWKRRDTIASFGWYEIQFSVNLSSLFCAFLGGQRRLIKSLSSLFVCTDSIFCVFQQEFSSMTCRGRRCYMVRPILSNANPSARISG